MPASTRTTDRSETQDDGTGAGSTQGPTQEPTQHHDDDEVTPGVNVHQPMGLH